MPNLSKSYFKLFANIIPVKGAKRSTVCDLQRGEYHFIPNILYSLLTEYKNSTISLIKNQYEEENHSTIDDYYTFLVDNELGFFTETPQLYPEIDLTFHTPSQITNAIIDFDANSNHPLDKIASELDSLGCKALQLRFFESIEDDALENVLYQFNSGRLESIDLVLPYRQIYTPERLKRLVSKFQRISFLIVHSSLTDEIIEHEKLETNIIYLTKKINSASHCGEIGPANFYINKNLFTESLKYNNCLNKKVGIDKNGNIKNCPTLTKSFGNIKDGSLTKAIFDSSFDNLWNINKNQIKVCKDCEFRYICTDCRAFIDPDNIHNAKPAKCNYNPYYAAWTEN